MSRKGKKFHCGQKLSQLPYVDDTWHCAGAPPQPVNFSTYINGEPVRNTDLVNWVTVGAFDVPTSESAPVTSTSGRTLSFWLLPYNYFDRVSHILLTQDGFQPLVLFPVLLVLIGTHSDSLSLSHLPGPGPLPVHRPGLGFVSVGCEALVLLSILSAGSCG